MHLVSPYAKIGLTVCEDCAAGKWSRHSGAIRKDMCSSCLDRDCGAGASLSFGLNLAGVNWQSLDDGERGQLRTNYPNAIAASCNATPTDATNLRGNVTEVS